MEQNLAMEIMEMNLYYQPANLIKGAALKPLIVSLMIL